MSLKNFILSKEFVKNLGLAIAIIVASIIILLIWMNLYTRHGQARPVPNFQGLTMEQTAKLAKKNKLKYQVIDSVYTTTVPRGCIAEQNPKPGFKVKKWRNITLTINAFKPEMVSVPNLVNLPIRQAQAMLESSGFEIGQLRYKPDLSINVVIQQLYKGKEIPAGDSLQKGSAIDLILGKGLNNQRTSIPYLLGMSLEAAKNKIMISSLNLGTFIFDNTIKTRKDSTGAFVFKQNPAYISDGTLQIGSDVYLWLTVDSAKLTMALPSNPADSIPVAEDSGTTPK